ncbi:hypothetical protein CAPTEDRAFT_136189, partial [Capitella teleta]
TKPRRHFYYQGQSLTLTIESSDRDSHQIVSRILKILLEEVLGYEKVEIRSGFNSINSTEALNRISHCDGCNASTFIPDVMINLEVWSPAGFNMEPWIMRDLLVDAGPLGPTGRFGWFVPTEIVEQTWLTEHHVIDHWRALTVDHVTDRFTLEDRMNYIRNHLSKPRSFESEETYCKCNRGILDENGCLGNHLPGGDVENCALLLSSYPGRCDQLREQIMSLNLDVAVSWIGPHLPKFITDRTERHEPTLFFNWIPNTLTATGNYTRIYFPSCKTGGVVLNDAGGPAGGCDFEVNQLSKFIWVRMKTHTPEAYHVITSMEFTQEEYEKLLRLNLELNPKYVDNSTYYDETACAWVKSNREKWTQWMPQNLSSKTKIYLGGMFPETGPYWRQPGIAPGAKMAVEAVNSDENILQDYEIVLLQKDTQCKADLVMKQFIYYVENETHPVVGILGPGCSETAAPIAGVSKHYNTIIVSYGAESLQLANREIFPLFFRTMPPNTQFGSVYIEIFKRLEWTQVALLAEHGQEFPEYQSFLKDKFLSNKMSVAYDRKMPRQVTFEEAKKFLEEIADINARIIILTSYEKAARAVICQAYLMKMTPKQGFVWFLPAWFTRNWWDTDNIQRSVKEEVPCSSQQMRQAVDCHFVLNIMHFGPLNQRIVGNMTVDEWLKRYMGRVSEQDLSFHASFAYDAVWVFALGLDKLLTADPSSLESIRTDRTTASLMTHLNNTQFDGASGPVRFTGANRNSIIEITQYSIKINDGIPIGLYQPNKNETERLKLNISQIIWPSGEKPVDGSEVKQCSIEAFRALLGVSCDRAIVVANVIGISAFGLCMLACFIVVEKLSCRYDRKVRDTRERMEELGLMAEPAWLSLDQWEVARDHVVLNRKLGEGAFGTVYGGEALIEEAWVAVAVKTLKIGSSTEEKMDFLGEAEMMKRFEHENIVKLLGVCTRGEPAYTIMELMLHGDLKTYLLSRRQMVGQAIPESDDITPERLTLMALDAAKGLKYLSDLKYIHRDLACRNCLVHVTKRIKIGDFGMTRPMYDSDYYRFNKRGMLPVRWMAPESLTLGMFTPHSDIWSYGVLLYEIMTFGSFPYQGLSNKQVLEFVKVGNTISVPAGCSELLGDVLKACWAFTADSRPDIQDIVDLFEDNPCLLKPCLDAPSAAVAIDTTGDLEMDMP